MRGVQSLDYEATENVGLRWAGASGGDKLLGSKEDACVFNTPQIDVYRRLNPCAYSVGTIRVDTAPVADGTHSVQVSVSDLARNQGVSTITARIDNTPPGRVDVAVEGGDGWRNHNDFVLAWSNQEEVDRAPISAATYRMCRATGGECRGGEHSEPGITRFGVVVPSPGEWTVSMWRRDAAGNQTDVAASVPVTLRYDPEPPKVTFEPVSTSDPTLVAVKTSDAVSGVADGAIRD